MTCFIVSGLLKIGTVRSVRTKVGATALTRMLSGAHSSASARVRLTIAPFDAWYDALGKIPPEKPMIDARLTIDPPPRRFMQGMTVREHRKTAARLRSMT